MNGRSHAVSGLATGLQSGVLYGLPPVQALYLSLICGGSAVLPDIDHPDSTVTGTFGWLTRRFSWVVRKASGGHRNGTHSALGAALIGLLAFYAGSLHTGHPWLLMHGLWTSGGLVLVAVPMRLMHGKPKPAFKVAWHGYASFAGTLTFAVGVVWAGETFGRPVGTAILGLIMMLALAAGVRTFRIKGKWDDIGAVAGVALALWLDVDLAMVPWAILLGVVVHIAGDAITYQGCPVGWPLSQRNVGPKFMVTGGKVENRIIVPALVLWMGYAAYDLAGLEAAVVTLAGMTALLMAGAKANRGWKRKKPKVVPVEAST